MNQYEENRLSMFYATRQVLNQHAATWGTVPALVTAKSELDANITSIEAALAIQVRDITGHAEAKAAAEQEMVDRTVLMAGSVMAWAEATNDEALAEEMNISRSELYNYRDSVVAQRCQGVHDAALANAGSLVDYGVSAGDIARLQNAIDAYLVVVQQPRNVIIARKAATAEIAMLVRDTQRLLMRRMDMLMRRYMGAVPELHRQYTSARIIIDRGGHKAVAAVA